MKSIVVFSLLFGATSAFVQPHPTAAVRQNNGRASSNTWTTTYWTTTSTTTTSTSIQESKKENNGLNMPDLSQAQDMINNAMAKQMLKKALNFDDVQKNLQAAMKNSNSGGEFGTRGEVYFAAQAVLVVSIALGGIPFHVSDIANFFLGPGLLLVGVATIWLSLQDLGSSLSPWVEPPENGSLTTDGIYATCRHPMYAGLLATLLGLSVVTGSADRLLLTGFLWYVLDLKTEQEEEGLKKKYPGDYSKYMVRTLLYQYQYCR